MKLTTPDELEAALRDIGAKRYHRLHPFHGLLHGGKCSKGQVQAWALNRYYYQAMIPIKDASLIARCEDSAVRREWRSRLVDHDGEREGDGGIARWLKLTDGLGLDRDYVTSLAGLLPATRFAVEAYVHFVREKTLLEAIASSLTELFSPQIIGERVEGMLKGYDFVTADTLAYFSKPPPRARRDNNFSLPADKRHPQKPHKNTPGGGDARQIKRGVLRGGGGVLSYVGGGPRHPPAPPLRGWRKSAAPPPTPMVNFILHHGGWRGFALLGHGPPARAPGDDINHCNAANSSRCSAARRRCGRSQRARNRRASCRPSGFWARIRLRPRANGPPLLCSGCASSAGSRAAPS